VRTAGVALGLAVLSTLAEEKTTDVLAGLGHRPSPAERADALLEASRSRSRSRRSSMAVDAVLLMPSCAGRTSRRSIPAPRRCRNLSQGHIRYPA
jgi:hypothetical protein